MNRTLIFLTIFIILCIYTCYSNNIETFAVDASTKEEIKKAVNETFTADVDAIRNLSEVAIKLQSGGLILPGNGSVRGTLTVDGDTNLKKVLNVDGVTTIKNDLNVTGKVKEGGNDLIPKGTIVAYHPPNFTDSITTITIPSGWALCDGTNGTPDLRGRFIKGASDTLTTDSDVTNTWTASFVTAKRIKNTSGVTGSILGASLNENFSWVFKMKHGDYGGTDHMRLDIKEMPTHSHNYTTFTGEANFKYGSNERVPTWLAKKNDAVTSNAGSNWGHNNIPPYYVLTYIMKL